MEETGATINVSPVDGSEEIKAVGSKESVEEDIQLVTSPFSAQVKPN